MTRISGDGSVRKALFPAGVQSCFFTILLCLLSTFIQPQRALAATPDQFATEPEVRIGILQKATHAKLRFTGSYRAFKGGGQNGGNEIHSGKAGRIQIELYTIRMAQIPQKLRVTLGAFRSYEQAEYTLQKLGSLPFKAQIAQPKQWTLWFGPFNSPDEAQHAQNYVRDKGFKDSRIESEAADITALTIYAQDGSLIHLGGGPVVFRSSNGRFFLNSREYRGKVEILPDAYGTFNVVNIVRADDYIMSVLPREMPSSAAPESLKAQAVIARTYLLNNMRRHMIDGFNLCSTTDCQVYGGVNDEVASTSEAVRRTRGQALIYKGQLANALFHSTCGGRTADYNDNWNGENPEYLVSVDDGSGFADSDLSSAKKVAQFLENKTGDCEASKYFRWEKKYTADEMLNVIKSTVPEFTNNPDLKINALRDISVDEYFPSGRAKRITVTTDAGEFVFERDAIRWVLGNIKSTLFILEKRGANGGREYVFRGAGWGHGVGLCQIGAMKLGKGGASYLRILDRYYPGSAVETLWK
ncbi:MAG: SpoIID/LytB domain-containing protein [bacterium]